MRRSGRARPGRNRKPPPPAVAFDEHLPISRKRRELADAIGRHQVTVVVGETGSGKSTQLPKICLAMGRGGRGYIGHTQPRRIAARSIAARISSELGTEPGTTVGFKTRFSERVRRETYIKVMTDGILLAELESDPRLARYDTLIIDEAHERSVNIDFLLGYLKRLLKRRHDLKLIVTSATIDPACFSRFFADAPVVEVAGKSFPVEVRYADSRESDDAVETSIAESVVDAVKRLDTEEAGDVLVFLPGEKEIRAAAGLLKRLRLPDTEFVPLFARLSMEEQQRIFQPHGARRIVLATNVAETSLTVPGIRYVIDTGLARISRYRPGRQVQALPIEPVSQASADQRKGRCGRTAEGICIRLYTREDLESRPLFTPPEILRTSLASIILRMKSMGLGDIGNFPFIDPPDARLVKDGFRLLEELGAVSDEHKLTRTGRRLARMPVDPRLGKMLLESGRLGCASEMLVICAALSVQDPRLYPERAREEARRQHARYADPDSDFVSLLNLWDAFHEEAGTLNRKHRLAYCRERYLSAARMREWRNVHDQLLDVCLQAGLSINRDRAGYKTLHRAMLPGLLGNVAVKREGREYTGTRGKLLHIHPASATGRRLPSWIMSAELVDTTRLFARTIARIEPGWVESAASGQIRRSWSDPRWDGRRGQVVATERVTLYGLELVTDRVVNLGALDAVEARKVFIAGALVPGRLGRGFPFQQHNARLTTEIERLEHKSRRRDILVDEGELFDFFDQRLPEGICDRETFSRWHAEAVRNDPDILCLTREVLMRRSAEQVTVERFPRHLEYEGNQLPCRYHFEPGHPNDGVTVRIPAELLPQIRGEAFSWLVPGLLMEKVIALIRGLPKRLRRHFVPAAEFAERSVEMLDRSHGSLTQSLGSALAELTGVRVDDEDWDEASLPDHLNITYEVLGPDGRVAACGRNLEAVRAAAGGHPAVAAPAAGPDIERSGITAWDFGDLPARLTVKRKELKLTFHPALLDERDTAAIRAFDDADEAAAAHPRGVRRLLCVQLYGHLRKIGKALPGINRMCLNFAGIGSCEALRQDIVDAALDQAVRSGGGAESVRTAESFERLLGHVRANLAANANELCSVVADALETHRKCRSEIDGCAADTASDIGTQLHGLVYDGFVSATPTRHLQHLPRYLDGVLVRIQRARHSPDKDGRCRKLIDPYAQRLAGVVTCANGSIDPLLEEYRWLLEEFRISLFAQELGTAVPVSAKRLDKKWAEFEARKTT